MSKFRGPFRTTRASVWLPMLSLASTAYAVDYPKIPDLKLPVVDTREKHFLQGNGVKYGGWHSSIMGAGGYIQNVVACPTNPTRFYAYVDVGGVYRSDDDAKTWKMLHGALPARLSSYEVRGLVVDPRDDKKILLAAGSRYSGGSGLWVSDDAGESFRQVLEAKFQGNGGDRASGFVLSRSAQNPDLIITATVEGSIYLSKDNGLTWTKCDAPQLEGTYPLDIRFDRTNSQRLWLSAKTVRVKEKDVEKEYSGGLFRSDDGGATWQRILEQTPWELAQDPKDGKVLYGIFDRQLIRRSLDGGATWEDFSDGLAIEILPPAQRQNGISGTAYLALGIGPDFIVTCTGSNSRFFVLKSGDTKWREVQRERVTVGDWYGSQKGSWFFGGAAGSITIDPHDPNRWFMTDLLAMHQTRDGGKNWRLCIDGVEVTCTHTLVQDPTDPAVIHLGQADIGPFVSTDGGARFTRGKVEDGPGAPSGGKQMKSMDMSPKNPNRLYAVGDKSYYVGWLANQVFTSSDRGKTWQRSPMTGLPDMAKRACTTITVDPNDPNTVYTTVAGQIGPNAGGVYKSTDGAQTWTQFSDGLPEGRYYFPFEIWAHGRQLAASSDGSLIALSQGSNIVCFYDKAEQKWKRTNIGSRGGRMYSVEADPFKPGRFFIAVRDEGLFRTEDGGATWKKIWTGSATYVAADRGVANRLACGTTNNGVILSLDGGDTWKELDKSLPYRVDNVPAFAGERLLVGSGGSGVFWMPLSPAGEKDVQAKP